MKVRALCATGLVAIAAVPASASASNSIQSRLHRADIALNRAQDAADAGNDAGVISGLKGATRQTNLALKAVSRLVKRDRDGADELLAEVTDQQDANALAAMDLLDGASSDVVAAVTTTLIAVDTGRGQVLTLIQGLGDNEVDWGDALTQVTDDAAGELAAAADNYGSADLSSAGEDALTAYVSHEADAADAVFAEVVNIGSNADAVLNGDALDNLQSDVTDAHDALSDVSGTSTGNASSISDAVTKLATLGDAVGQLADTVNGSYDGYGDPGSSYDNSGDGYDSGYSSGFQDGFAAGWFWAPPHAHHHGYGGWQPDDNSSSDG